MHHFVCTTIVGLLSILWYIIMSIYCTFNVIQMLFKTMNKESSGYWLPSQKISVKNEAELVNLNILYSTLQNTNLRVTCVNLGRIGHWPYYQTCNQKMSGSSPVALLVCQHIIFLAKKLIHIWTDQLSLPSEQSKN